MRERFWSARVCFQEDTATCCFTQTNRDFLQDSYCRTCGRSEYTSSQLGHRSGRCALACALRRAEFAGQAAVFRLAAVGILWTSERLIASAHETVREPLIRFRQLAAEYFETQVVPLSVALYLGISAKDLARFSDGVNEFLRRDAAEDAELWKLFND